MSELARPLHLFLDTNHAINIARLRVGGQLRGKPDLSRVRAYRQLDEWIKSACFIPLFCETMTYEWMRAQSDAIALQVAAVFDSACCVKQVLPDPLVYIVEAMNECLRQDPSIDYTAHEVVREMRFDGELVRWFTKHWPDKTEHPTVVAGAASLNDRFSVVGFVQAVASGFRGSPTNWSIALKGESTRLKATRETIARSGDSKAAPEIARRYFLRSALWIDRVLASCAPNADINALLRGIEWDACPALDLYFRSYWNYAKANREPKQGDFVDLTMFPPLAYTDVGLIENRMHEILRQSRREWDDTRVFRDPVTLVDAVKSRIR